MLGMELIGRIGIGIVELIVGILFLVLWIVWIGVVISLGVISGVIFFYLMILGINYNGDGGVLFIMVVIVFIIFVIVLWIERV